MDLTISLDEVQLKAVQRALRNVPQGLPRAVSRVINRQAAKVHTQVNRLLAKESGDKYGEVRKIVTLRRATFRKWSASILIRGRRRPIIKLGAKQTALGVTYRAGKGEKGFIRSAFIATMNTPRQGKGGHVGAFKRRGKKRLPIDELVAKTYPEYFNESGEATQIINAIPIDLEKALNDQVLILTRSQMRN